MGRTIIYHLILWYTCLQCVSNNPTSNISLTKVPNTIFDIGKENFIENVSKRENNTIGVNINSLLSNYVGELPLLIKHVSQALEGILGPSAPINEDVNLNITQLIQKYRYDPQIHEVQTIDGYILTLYRIPGNGTPVFLMHGLLCSSDDWITAGPESGIAYLLASEGYDVWLGNARGNKHSRRHADLSPDSAQYWDFSWDEIGRYDLPAMIDYVLQKTNQLQLKYVGHSQGTTSFFVMCSERPEYNDKVSIMVALSAMAWMSHLENPIIRLYKILYPIITPFLPTYEMTKKIGLFEILPDTTLMRTLKTTLCGQQTFAEVLCSNFLFLLAGFDYEQLNVPNLPVIFGHVPSGAATKQLVHYGQSIVSGEFKKFDYGHQNIDIYGVVTPPSYSVENITTPVAIFYGEGDWIASVTDINILHKRLKNVVDFYKVPHENFNHLDFLWAKDLKSLIFHRLLELLKNNK